MNRTDAAPEGGAKSGRTLKLKASEASNEASAGWAAEPPAEASSNNAAPDAIQTVKTARLRGGRRGRQRRPRRIPIPPALTP